MVRFVHSFVVAATILACLTPAKAETTRSIEQAKRPRDAVAILQPSPYMRVLATTPPPYGFVNFCEATPEECVSDGKGDERITAGPADLSELDEVNRWVNAAVAPATDLEIYGMTEYWTLPGRRGDCEDYALLKRHILMQRGWPASALLLTVVRDEKGEGHAVLTVRTSLGDFLLDNKVDDVKVWHKAPYSLVMRQSAVNPRAWVSLDPAGATAPQHLAGMQRPRR